MDAPVGGDDLGTDQVVDRQAVATDEVPDASSRGDAADPDRRGVAEADDEPVRQHRGSDLAGGEAGAGPQAAATDVEVDALEVAQVDDDPAIGRAVAGGRMPAAANGQLGADLGGVANDPRDVLCARDADDRPGPEVDAAHHDGAELVVVGVAGNDHAAIQAIAQSLDGDRWGRCGHGTPRR